MNTIRQLCTRCVVLHQGKIINDGNAEEAIAIYIQNEVKELSDDINPAWQHPGWGYASLGDITVCSSQNRG